jgi:AcrR family transcriptional regulator
MNDPTKSKKYSALLEAGRKLFWKHGVRRVSVEEICKAANTSKMTFYRLFPGKIELAKAVLDKFYRESMTSFRKIIRDESSPSEKMHQMINMKLEGSYDISSEFIQDFLINDDFGLSAYLSEILNGFRKEIIKEFKAGQEEGWIRKDLNVEFLFYFSQKIIPVLNDKELRKLFNSPGELIAEMANLIVYGISPLKKNE